MVTREDIEGFLERIATDGTTFRGVEDGLWVVKPGDAIAPDLVVSYAPPVVVLRVKVMDVGGSDAGRGALYRRLLELNASDLVHGSYGVEGDAVVLTEALELQHLDFTEFLAAYEGMTLALGMHLRELGEIGGGR